MLNAKKKKNFKTIALLGIWLLGQLGHCWLSRFFLIVKNYGVSFGIEGWFFLLLNVVLLIFFILLWIKNNYLGLGMIIIGGLLNLTDRLFLGYVRDYWRIGLVYNNLPDWIIQVGIILFLIELWKKELK